MKIIKSTATELASWKKEVTCKNCESVLEVEFSDLRAQYHEGWSDPRDGSGEAAYYSYYCNCGVCSQKIEFSNADITKYMGKVLQEKQKHR